MYLLIIRLPQVKKTELTKIGKGEIMGNSKRLKIFDHKPIEDGN
jgi:hypothetical protein